MNSVLKLVLLAFLVAACAGCGSSGGSNASATSIPPEVQAGYAERARNAEALSQRGKPQAQRTTRGVQ